MEIIDGRALAKQIQHGVKTEIKRLGLNPGLAVILVGDNPASHLYVSLKEKAAREVGIKFEKYVFAGTKTHYVVIPRQEAEESRPIQNNGILRGVQPRTELRSGAWAQNDSICGCQQCVLSQIKGLNQREDIHGILVQVPLPPGYDEDIVIGQIDPKKDVDGFHQVNLRAILAGEPWIFPAVALGIVALIDDAARTVLESQGQSSLTGKKAILLVNRTEFAAPVEYLLKQRGAQVQTILRAKEITPDIAAQLRTADVLVVARGHAEIVKGKMIKDDAIVIDAGTNKLPDGRVVGDVDFASVQNQPGFITPVPGGVGPMTVALLLKNTLELTK